MPLVTSSVHEICRFRPVYWWSVHNYGFSYVVIAHSNLYLFFECIIWRSYSIDRLIATQWDRSSTFGSVGSFGSCGRNYQNYRSGAVVSTTTTSALERLLLPQLPKFPLWSCSCHQNYRSEAVVSERYYHNYCFGAVVSTTTTETTKTRWTVSDMRMPGFFVLGPKL